MTERPAALTHLQEQIAARSKRLGLSMRKLSMNAGLNDTAVKAIMSGRSINPRGDTLQAIAQALGTTVQKLLGDASDPHVVDAEIPAASVTPQNEAVEALRERESQLATEIEEYARRSERASLRLEEVRAILARLCRSPEPDQEPPAAPQPRSKGQGPPSNPFPEGGRVKENRVSRPLLKVVGLSRPCPTADAERR